MKMRKNLRWPLPLKMQSRSKFDLHGIWRLIAEIALGDYSSRDSQGAARQRQGLEDFVDQLVKGGQEGQ